MNVQGEHKLKPQTIRHLMKHGISNYNYLKPSKPIHDFSLILSKRDDVVVVACRNYPECTDTITVFGMRN